VPRHLFIPDTIWHQDPAISGPNDLVPVHCREQADRWLEIAYTDRRSRSRWMTVVQWVRTGGAGTSPARPVSRTSWRRCSPPRGPAG
jgi:hypothetical protein